MKATIKKTKTRTGYQCYEVYKGEVIRGETVPCRQFFFTEKNKKEALKEALSLAKVIESEPEESYTVYESGKIKTTLLQDTTGEVIDPLDFFMAANMNDNEIISYIKNASK